MNSPLLHLGLDIGIRRDTTALTAVYFNPDWQAYCLWGHMCWEANKDAEGHNKDVIIQEATDKIVSLCENANVVALWYDEYQYISEAQRIRKAGFGRILKPVNQQGENTAFSNCLKGHLDDGDFLMYKDTQVLNHFKNTSVEVGERGWRIVKRKQTRPIDLTVSIAMALYGCAQSKDYQRSTYSENKHTRSLMSAA
jgi:hypothetical protein